MTRRSARIAASCRPSLGKEDDEEDDDMINNPAAVTSKSSATLSKNKGGTKNSASNTKKRANTPAVSSARVPSKKKRTGLKEAINASAPLGVVDKEANIEGSIEMLDSEPCDVMLALVDPAKHMDKFYILQLIKKDDADSWVVYTRWGRTGTSGQALMQDFDELNYAVNCFQDKFQQKTGLEWTDRHQPTVGSKYRFITQDFEQKYVDYSGAKWQYWVDDGVDGKATAWYDYDQAGSRQVEQLFVEHTHNPLFSQRLVDSGSWTYNVDLAQMIQTNVTHPNHTSRRIRRVPNGEDVDIYEPPTPLVAVPMPATSAGPNAAISGPVPVTSGSAIAISGPNSVIDGLIPAPVPSSIASLPVVSPNPTPVKSSSVSEGQHPKTSGSHPVDPDVTLLGKVPSDYQVVQSNTGPWYDIVLNQCNIGGNNNKYYRLQMLMETASSEQFYVWFKWGRVGEAASKGTTTWLGPFVDKDAAYIPFAKKYRDKTGNKFGTDEFTAKKGKYVPIEIDNDVQVKEEFVSTSTAIKEEFEYLPAALDPKTKELVEVLFSKEMRNEALTAFNLDLKKLPLGVPSQQQIQHGISILSEIEDKLNGGAVDESYEELSSRFYTAIPHSFGRSRPPVISSTDALQGRYDMCNILLDMYSTNETIREIEQRTPTKKQVPCPTDQHYHSLNANLTFVDPSSDDFKVIETYFSKTKASWSNDQLLNVWSVDRRGEANRFVKYDKLGNRRLLWHGTNIAVVAPILTSGLRIMPHSGGRVGAGIYLASLQEKSAQYTCGYGAKFACMFLVEAPLGESFVLNQDGSHASSLKKAPSGYDSVHAVGTMQPKTWKPMSIEGKDVQVPQTQPEASGIESSFQHDEYLVYEEGQVRLRYVVTVKK